MDDLKGYTSDYKSLCEMANLIESLSIDIGMEFGLSKWKCVNMAGGWYKVKQMGSIQLQSGGIIEEIEANGSYKYLGVEELDAIKHSDK